MKQLAHKPRDKVKNPANGKKTDSVGRGRKRKEEFSTLLPGASETKKYAAGGNGRYEVLVEHKKKLASQNAIRKACPAGQPPKNAQEALQAVQQLLERGFCREALAVAKPYAQQLDIVDALARSAIRLAHDGKGRMALLLLEGIKPDSNSKLIEVDMQARMGVHENLLAKGDVTNAIMVERRTPDPARRGILVARRLLLSLDGQNPIDRNKEFEQVRQQVLDDGIRQCALYAIAAIYQHQTGEKLKAREIANKIREPLIRELVEPKLA